MRQFLKPFIAIAILAIVLTSLACSQTRTAPAAMPASPPMAATSTPSFLAQSKSAGPNYSADESGAGAGQSSANGVTDDRKIVRTGSLTMEVADIGKSLDDIAAIAVQYDGYVVASNQRGDSDSPTGYISIRVSAAKFSDALQKLKTLATKVTYENTNSQDVTEQYMDLQAQLKNYEATEAQYLELLKKAESVQDILDVQKELSNVRGNIERTKGRIQYIERTSDMSLIETSLLKSKPIGQSSWDVPGIFKAAVDGLVAFSKVLLYILIWLLVFSPIWIIVLVIIFIVLRRKRKKAKLEASK
jgi:hypothetical protein